MAYFSKEDKARVTPLIKAVLKKYGVKGSIARRHYSTLVVNIKSGVIDFIGGDKKIQKLHIETRGLNGHVCERTSLDINEYHVVDSLRKVNENTQADFFEELIAAMKSAGWYDRSDIQSDYFDTAYYIDINVGKWNKPYILTK